MVFCDWISLIVDNYSDIDIDDGLFVDLKKDGSINYQVQKRLSLEGSWSEKVSVRAWAGAGQPLGNAGVILPARRGLPARHPSWWWRGARRWDLERRAGLRAGIGCHHAPASQWGHHRWKRDR